MIPLTIILIRMETSPETLGSPAPRRAVDPAKPAESRENPIVWIPISGVLLSLARFQLPHLLKRTR